MCTVMVVSCVSLVCLVSEDTLHIGQHARLFYPTFIAWRCALAVAVMLYFGTAVARSKTVIASLRQPVITYYSCVSL